MRPFSLFAGKQVKAKRKFTGPTGASGGTSAPAGIVNPSSDGSSSDSSDSEEQSRGRLFPRLSAFSSIFEKLSFPIHSSRTYRCPCEDEVTSPPKRAREEAGVEGQVPSRGCTGGFNPRENASSEAQDALETQQELGSVAGDAGTSGMTAGVQVGGPAAPIASRRPRRHNAGQHPSLDASFQLMRSQSRE